MQDNKKLQRKIRYFKKHFVEYLIVVLLILFIISTFWNRIVVITSTFFITLTTGVLIFICGQLILKLIIEPVLEVKRTIGRIAYTLKFYANIYDANNIDYKTAESAIDETRKLSCELEANYNALFFKDLPTWVLPKKKDIAKVAFDLIFVSNNVGIAKDARIKGKQNYEVILNIKKLLNIVPIGE